MTNLRDEIARHIDPKAWADSSEDSYAARISKRGPSKHKADCILSIPEIAEALEGHRARNDTYLTAKGHRISTGTS